MDKVSFNKLDICKQVDYFNLRLLEGDCIQSICKSINISYSTIRDRFKKHNYKYNKLSKKYENKLDLPENILYNLLSQLTTKESTLICEKRNSKLISRSFRIHDCVLNEFINFCNKSDFTQQEILSQFIADGLNKYKLNA